MPTRLTRTLAAAVVTGAAITGAAATLAAQGAAPQPIGREFRTGALYVGPRVWLGNLNGAVAIGGQVERGFTEAGRYGPGIIAGGVGLDWYSWSQNYSALGKYEYSVVPVQVFGNYHFVLDKNKRWDPYVGLALVYSHYSSSWSGSAVIPGGASASASTTAFAGQGGVRYFVNDRVSLSGQVGFGYGTLGLGAAFKL